MGVSLNVSHLNVNQVETSHIVFSSAKEGDKYPQRMMQLLSYNSASHCSKKYLISNSDSAVYSHYKVIANLRGQYWSAGTSQS